MSELMLFSAASEPMVKAITLEEFAAVFGSDAHAWGALDCALFRMEKVVRFTHRSSATYYIGPFNPHDEGLPRGGWIYNCVDYEELSQGAETLLYEHRRELAVAKRREVATVQRDYRVNFTAHPPLYASAIVKAANANDAEQIARTDFYGIRDDLREIADNAFRDWEPEPHHFHFESVEAVE